MGVDRFLSEYRGGSLGDRSKLRQTAKALNREDQLNTLRRIIRSANRGDGKLLPIMASAPTVTISANGAVSTISGTAVDAPTIPINNGSFRPLGGNGQWRVVTGQTTRFTTSRVIYDKDTTKLLPAHGFGIEFGFYGQTFDVGLGAGGGTVIAYFTNVDTGQRLRAQAADYAGSGSTVYYKWDMGVVGTWIVEIITANYGGWFTGVNVAGDGFVWLPPAASQNPDVISMLTFGDSYDAGSISQAANKWDAKLVYSDVIGEMYGVVHPIICGVGGTGWLNDSTVALTYLQRIQAGQMDQSLIGAVDLACISFTGNDALAQNAAFTDQALYDAAVTGLKLVRQKQPQAAIVVHGQATPQNFPLQPSRAAAEQAAFNAVFAGDNLAFFVPGTTFFAGNAAGGINKSMIGPDGSHPNLVGARYLAKRRSAEALNQMRTRERTLRLAA